MIVFEWTKEQDDYVSGGRFWNTDLYPEKDIFKNDPLPPIDIQLCDKYGELQYQLIDNELILNQKTITNEKLKKFEINKNIPELLYKIYNNEITSFVEYRQEIINLIDK